MNPHANKFHLALTREAGNLQQDVAQLLGTLLEPTTRTPDCKPRIPELKLKPKADTPSTLKLASLNCQIIYGREKSVAQFMEDQNVDILGMQELKLHANLPPQGLPDETILQEHSRPGIRATSG